MPAFATERWFQDFIALINASGEYREAASGWEGDIAFLIEAEPDRGVAHDIWGRLDLWHGACRGGGVTDPERGAASEYVIRAPYSRWKEVVSGELEPVKGMMQGKLRVEGDLPMIVRYIRAANVLAALTEEVDTSFPDDA